MRFNGIGKTIDSAGRLAEALAIDLLVISFKIRLN
jgi:hypothetical protein